MLTRDTVGISFGYLNVSFFRNIFSVRVSVTVFQVWPLAVGENLSYAHSNGTYSVAMAMYPYVLVRKCSLEQSFKPFYNIPYVYWLSRRRCDAPESRSSR